MFKAGSSSSLKISKPSGSEAKELARLFPQSIHSGKRRILSDPNQPLEGSPDKKKKRGSTSLGKTHKLTVCRLPSFTTSVPKGKARRILKEQKRIVDVQVTRAMPASVVKEVLNRAYRHLDSDWEFLETGQDNLLNVAENQSLDGNTVCSRRGCMYIVDKKVCVMLFLLIQLINMHEDFWCLNVSENNFCCVP